MSRCTYFLSPIFCRILHSVVLSDRHEDLAATFFCALDADHSGFLTEMDISLLSTESQSMKNRDVRDNVNLGGDGIRRGSVSKKSDGLKDFIRHVLKMSSLLEHISACSCWPETRNLTWTCSKCPQKKVNFKQFNAWLQCNRSVALDCLSARLAIQRVISECEVSMKKTQILNICDFAFVNRMYDAPLFTGNIVIYTIC